MRPAAWPLLALAWALVPAASRADGALPPLPYRYLDPPAGLTRANAPPVPEFRVLPSGYLRAVGWSVYTADSQAGLIARRNALRLPRATSSVAVEIRPVHVPPGLNRRLAADGNAYRITVFAQPGPGAASLAHPLDVVLRFPHLPVGIDLYRNGRWQRLCSADQAAITATSIACATRQLGVFLAVTTPARTRAASRTGSGAGALWTAAVAAAALGVLPAAFLWARRQRARIRRRQRC